MSPRSKTVHLLPPSIHPLQFRKLTDIHFVLAVHSDTHRVGYGPLRSHLLRKKSLQDARNPTLPKPAWDEKHLFHMCAYERAFKVQLTILDWDKLSSNDHVGDVEFMVADLIPDALQRDESTGLYGEEADRGHMMKEFKVPLISSNGKGAVLWEAKNNPSGEFLPLKRSQFGR